MGDRPRRPAIEMPGQKIAETCRKYHIRRLALFGSVVRDDFTPASDVDALAWFEPEHIPGFMGLARIQEELSERIGRRVDLQTPPSLSRHFRDEVLAEALDVYVEAQ